MCQNDDLDCERAVSNSFSFTKSVAGGSSSNMIVYREFRTFLRALAQYFDYYEVREYQYVIIMVQSMDNCQFQLHERILRSFNCVVEGY